MPLKFEKIGLRRKIPKDLILRAIEEVSKDSKIKTTADKYQIPRLSLQRYLKVPQDSNKIAPKDWIRYSFFFPCVDDIASVPLEDIKTKLPIPKTCNKTKRGSSKYTFDKPLWVLTILR
ncbi:hypothetical protein WA026_023208 [Henosepilachna vigintioctopunctata]|uniref:HTH psq-type domain-containing protein n=1 Tax=Henosepilachna vigintioctopunctata TaxID=420089 RepID=A0AAW1VJN0_9CUCU